MFSKRKFRISLLLLWACDDDGMTPPSKLRSILRELLLLGVCFQYLVISGVNHGLRNQSFPILFLIGAQKAGTTSLVDLLLDHNEICRDGTKEKHFFDNPSVWDSNDGAEIYASKFSRCSPDELTFDGTPMSHVDAVPQRISASYSTHALMSKKIILVLREPVSRDFSFFEHRMRACEDYITNFDKVKEKRHIQFISTSCEYIIPAFDPNLSRAFAPITFREYYENSILKVTDSEYLHQIKNWLQHFDRSQLFIVNMDRLVSETAFVMKHLAIFLGLVEGWGENVELPHDNDSSHMRALLDCATYDKLQAHYSVANAGLVDFINHHPNKPPSEPHFLPFRDTRSNCFPMHPRVPTPVIRHYITGADIFLIGTAGDPVTKYLESVLLDHPNVCTQKNPNKQFFNDDSKWAHGVDGYDGLFRGCHIDKLKLDSTPMFHDIAVPDRIRAALSPETLAQKKFLLVLRSPLTHEYIAFDSMMNECQKQFSNHSKPEFPKERCLGATNTDTSSFSTFFNRLTGLKADSYSLHLRNWLRVLQQNQVFIINADTFESNVDVALEQIQTFLQVRQVEAFRVRLEDFLPAVGVSTVDLACEHLRELVKSFQSQNEGLAAMVNAPNAPPSQPPFAPFELSTHPCLL